MFKIIPRQLIKHKDVEVEIVKKVYEEAMLQEINEDRIRHGKKPLKDIEKTEIMYDEETGEVIENKETKHIKESLTDPESGCFHKGEKEKCFAYTHQTFCDKNGFVLTNTTTAGNVHDSVAFFVAYHVLNEKFKNQNETVGNIYDYYHNVLRDSCDFHRRIEGKRG